MSVRRRRRRRRGQLIAGATVAAVAGAVVVLTVPGDDDDIRRAADRLAVPGSWDLEGDRVTPPRLLCLGGNPCPSAQRTWRPGQNLSAAELEALVAPTGWDLAWDGDCTVDASSLGRHEVCAGTGEGDGYAVTLSHSASHEDPSEALVQLELMPLP
ncbi:hypothetical protein [Blastococcus atacamensis]|uniref:hypothetical protein n=1 Tax=Blastococcus atacamensis TaxID=2070508 RepID=UPI000CECDCE8|nr:hypothetical protein [Blastococcus atacamensis]